MPSQLRRSPRDKRCSPRRPRKPRRSPRRRSSTRCYPKSGSSPRGSRKSKTMMRGHWKFLPSRLCRPRMPRRCRCRGRRPSNGPLPHKSPPCKVWHYRRATKQRSSPIRCYCRHGCNRWCPQSSRNQATTLVRCTDPTVSVRLRPILLGTTNRTRRSCTSRQRPSSM